MTLPAKAILLNVRTFLADNNIKRSTSSFDINYSSESEDLRFSAFGIDPGVAKQLVTPMALSTVAILRTTSPLIALITPRGRTAFTIKVNKMFILDDDIAEMVLTNPSTTTIARVSFQQG